MPWLVQFPATTVLFVKSPQASQARSIPYESTNKVARDALVKRIIHDFYKTENNHSYPCVWVSDSPTWGTNGCEAPPWRTDCHTLTSSSLRLSRWEMINKVIKWVGRNPWCLLCKFNLWTIHGDKGRWNVGGVEVDLETQIETTHKNIHADTGQRLNPR